jgi:hypothetical protein
MRVANLKPRRRRGAEEFLLLDVSKFSSLEDLGALDELARLGIRQRFNLE